MRHHNGNTGTGDRSGAGRTRSARVLAGPALAAALGLGAVACGGSAAGSSAPVVVQQTPVYGDHVTHGFVTLPAGSSRVPTQQFTTMAGRTWRFDSVKPHELTLLYYGYTHCPDICPTTMADLAAAMRSLSGSDRERTSVVFISTDPHRDTIKQMRLWLGQFDHSFIGIRAPIHQVVTTARRYGIGVTPPKVVAGQYQVTHGAQVAVLGPGGHQLGYFKTLTASHDYAAEVHDLLARGK